MPARAFGRRARPLEGSAPAASPPPPGGSAPAPAPLTRRRTESGETIAEIATRLHPVVVRSLDMTKVANLDNQALAAQLQAFLETEQADVPGLSPLDRQRVVTHLVHDIKGLGPIEPLLVDESISDILINGLKSAYIERYGRLEPIELRFRDGQHLFHIAQRIAGRVGRRIDEVSPMVDARLADGSRVNIIIPPLALDGAAISIRRFVFRSASLEQMAEGEAFSPAMARFLRIAMRTRLNIIISGGTGAGKTTFMNALSREIDHTERLVTIEDAAELQLQQPHVVRLETRAISPEGTGQISMRALLINSLRMRPDRIIVGEVRGEEANEMLQAMNTGHPGSMCTLHANTPRDALTRLENMLLMASGDIPLPALRRQIASSVDLVIQLARLRTGHRCVTSITNVVGIENDVITTEELWRRRPGSEAHVFETSGRQPSWTEAARAIGLYEELMETLQADPRIGEAPA
ncbi:MAG: CpaF family protein [Rhodospirillales bacterium]|nr:CpaF family protein [Rhodospirillales bacterium]